MVRGPVLGSVLQHQQLGWCSAVRLEREEAWHLSSKWKRAGEVSVVKLEEDWKGKRDALEVTLEWKPGPGNGKGKNEPFKEAFQER